MSDLKAFFGMLSLFLVPGSGFSLTIPALAGARFLPLTSANNRHMAISNFASLRLKTNGLILRDHACLKT
jgi:hypothetical protein